MGFEPTTFSLARRRSTAEPRPRCTPRLSMGHSESYRERKGVSTRAPTTSSKPLATGSKWKQDTRHRTQEARRKTLASSSKLQASRITFYASRFTLYVLRFSLP